MNWFEKLQDKLKLGPHYKMERFTLVFGILAVVLLVVTTTSIAIDRNNQNEQLDTVALFTDKFTTSRTNVSGTVDGVYVSDDKTRAFVLMKFSDTKKVSTDAGNYRAFLTGASIDNKQEKLLSQPSGSIYVFGTSGYVGVYLVDAQGFKPQILDMTLRCDAELSKVNNEQAENKVDQDFDGDASFAEHDQLKVYFNPGGSDATVIQALNSGSAPSKLDLYEQTVLDTESDETIADLNEDAEQMRIDLNTIQEYTQRLENTDQIQVPATPSVIAGDTITYDMNTKHYDLHFASVVPGGYDFDWQDTTVKDGWLDDLIAETDTPNMTYDQFFAMKATEAKADKTSGAQSPINTNITWTFKDGTLLEDLNNSGSASKYAKINEDCQQLTQAWSTYYQHKKEYQVTGLGALLDMESAAKQVRTSASVNTSDDVLTIY